MRIELECCGLKPISMEVSTNVPKVNLTTLGNKIIIESTNEPISCLTLKRRSMYSSKLCYLNILNPIYYFYQYKLNNRDVYLYDDDYFWMDIVFDNVITSNLTLKLIKQTKQFAESTYSITQCEHNKCFNIHYHNMPQIQIFRYKVSNILSQLFWSILISFLAIWQLCIDQKNIFLYLSGIAILLLFSSRKIFKYCYSKSKGQFINKTR